MALGEDGTPRLFDLDYWREDFVPDGMPEGMKFVMPAILPK